MKKGTYNRALVFFIAGLLSIALFLSMQGSALASAKAQKSVRPLVTCSGNGCNNTDPFATGCADTNLDIDEFLTHTTDENGVWVELWYSKVCHTNFTIIYADYSDAAYYYGQINRDTGSDGGALSYSYSSSQHSWINTNQVYSPHNAAQACGAGSNAPVVCTVFV